MSRIRLAGFTAAMGVLIGAGFPVQVAPASERSVRAPATDSSGAKSTAQVGIGVNKYVRHEARGYGGKRGSPRRPGPGWTHAQVQRMARKRRNVLRNRKAHR